MKKTFLIVMLLSIGGITAQTQPRVENYPLKAMDLVLYCFGMENPVHIGTISASGELDFNFPKDLNFIADEAKANFMSDAAFTFFPKCANSYDILTESENIKAINAGYISLSTKDNPYSGLLFMVTDENIVPWIESYGDIDAVLGSYFELVCVESDFNYQGECMAAITYIEHDPIETIYTYDLQLKAGFNFIEYKIERAVEHKIPSMYEEGIFDKIDKPTKITVTSTQSTPPTTLWIGKYF
tara:strand:- start:532 stop:1254 length:723 start_codon:yes stop_codon:yes gene_type:complete